MRRVDATLGAPGSLRFAETSRDRKRIPATEPSEARRLSGWHRLCDRRIGDSTRRTMIVALTHWNGRVSPVLDVSREAWILTIESGTVTGRSNESIETPTTALKIERLTELGVETLICGAISGALHNELTARRVKVVGFVAGEIDEVVESFLAGTLPTPALSMPGYCGRQNRFRGGRGRGGRRWGSTGRP
jgi:predicted Fe-Mo cluster-binding NifX family protein